MPATLEPIRFWSYARSDDEASNERLSTLRGLLRAELKLHWGRREVRIWQDLEAVAYGANWLAEIEQAIAESSFFIPIVTRAFLESQTCCQEVMLFYRHRLALGRNDLIFPFHFADVTRVRAEECEDRRCFRYCKSVRRSTSRDYGRAIHTRKRSRQTLPVWLLPLTARCAGHAYPIASQRSWSPHGRQARSRSPPSHWSSSFRQSASGAETSLGLCRRDGSVRHVRRHRLQCRAWQNREPAPASYSVWEVRDGVTVR